MECWIPLANDISNFLVPFEHATTLVAVIELGLRSWLISGSALDVAAAVIKTLAKAIEARDVGVWRPPGQLPPRKFAK
jgi:hypothetical protein